MLKESKRGNSNSKLKKKSSRQKGSQNSIEKIKNSNIKDSIISSTDLAFQNSKPLSGANRYGDLVEKSIERDNLIYVGGGMSAKRNLNANKIQEMTSTATNSRMPLDSNSNSVTKNEYTHFNKHTTSVDSATTTAAYPQGRNQ